MSNPEEQINFYKEIDLDNKEVTTIPSPHPPLGSPKFCPQKRQPSPRIQHHRQKESHLSHP